MATTPELVATYSARSGVKFHKATCKRIPEGDRISTAEAFLFGGGRPATCCKPKAEAVGAEMDAQASAAMSREQVPPGEAVPSAQEREAWAALGVNLPDLTEGQKVDGLMAGMAAVLNGADPAATADAMVAAAAEGATLADPLTADQRQAFGLLPAGQVEYCTECHSGTKAADKIVHGEGCSQDAKPRSAAARKAAAESTRATEPKRQARRATAERDAADARVDELVDQAKARAAAAPADNRPAIYVTALENQRAGAATPPRTVTDVELGEWISQVRAEHPSLTVRQAQVACRWAAFIDTGDGRASSGPSTFYRVWGNVEGGRPADHGRPQPKERKAPATSGDERLASQGAA